jgi:hypothetical protein
MGNPSQPTAGFKEFLDAYHLALGRFIDEFSQTENLVQMALISTAHVSDPVARAVFSGARVDTASQYIRRIFEANGQKLPDTLDRVFTQLKIISDLRNSIMHYGYKMFQDLEWFTSNDHIAMPNKAKRFRVSPDILDKLTQDLKTINFTLVFYIGSFNPTTPQELKTRHEFVLHEPWQYKPPGQSTARSKNPQTRVKRRSQPESSQE